MSLTVAYVTCRKEPCFDWFFWSLKGQEFWKKPDAPPLGLEVIVVDFYADDPARKKQVSELFPCGNIRHVTPKPTIWQGPHRLTTKDWWAASNARNTAFCLCRTDWIAFCDDRCLLTQGWLNAVYQAMKYGYAVAGAYEKRVGMRAYEGAVLDHGKRSAQDSRRAAYDRRTTKLPKNTVVRCPPEWWFGCTNALPLEWALTVNGYDETADGLSMEDVLFGLMLANNDYPICYDPKMMLFEDETGQHNDNGMRRADKGVSPNDKSHALLNMLRPLKRSMHQWDLRAVREKVLAGEPFPIPTGPDRDWYDGQLIAEMV